MIIKEKGYILSVAQHDDGHITYVVMDEDTNNIVSEGHINSSGRSKTKDL